MEIKRAAEVNHKLPINKGVDYPYALSEKIFHTKQLFIYSEKIKPGKKSSAPHIHQAIDEVIHITKGELVAFEGEESFKLNSGDSVCFYANSDKKHFLENQSNSDAEFLLIRRATQKDDVVY